MINVISKDCLIKYYIHTLLNSYSALNDEEKWISHRTMDCLEQLAMVQYDFEFTMELRRLAHVPIEDLLALED